MVGREFQMKNTHETCDDKPSLVDVSAAEPEETNRNGGENRWKRENQGGLRNGEEEGLKKRKKVEPKATKL